MNDPVDIAVLGSGPAALAVAGALRSRDASVLLVAPAPRASWKPMYAMWRDEVPPTLEDAIERCWDGTLVRTLEGAHEVGRAYAKLDTARYRASMWGRLDRGGVEVIADRAVAVDATPDGADVQTESGQRRSARVVVDASGAETPFVERVHARPPAYQMAYGLLLDAPGHGFDAQQAVLMDFVPADPASPDPASFLYALPLDGDRLFVEETSLARRPAMAIEDLAARLELRLAAHGLQGATRVAEEHCRIPMGLGLPKTRQRVVPFGAAAAMVHPASGYLQAHIHRKAPVVADAIMSGLASGGGHDATARANEAVWSTGERKAWELYAVGLESLVGMTAAQMGRFFHGFFSLPTASWSGYLAGTLAPPALRTVMNEVFRTLPLGLRWQLLRSSVTKGAAPLARSLVPRTQDEPIS
ncbi:MAG: lycopene cyclase family protein [Myxococcota bacterium]